MEKTVFCIDCIHYREDLLKPAPVCMAVYPHCFDLVTGQRTVDPPSCMVCRDLPTRCGLSGMYFEPKAEEEDDYEPSTLFKQCRDVAPSIDGKIKVIAGRGDREVK